MKELKVKSYKLKVKNSRCRYSQPVMPDLSERLFAETRFEIRHPVYSLNLSCSKAFLFAFLIASSLLIFVPSAQAVDFNCPGGQWVVTEYQEWAAVISGCWLASSASCETISGDTWTVDQFACMYKIDGSPCLGEHGGSPSCSAPGYTEACTAANALSFQAVHAVSKWQCPSSGGGSSGGDGGGDGGGGAGTDDEAQACENNKCGNSCESNIPIGSSANPGSGNLYHDQTLFNTNTLGFTLSYNSIDNFGSPLGKGWTHNYNLLLFGGHAGSLGLKQGDGRIVYFRLDNGIYYPDASSGETSYLTFTNNAYTLTEKNGITYTFNSNGKLTSIRDRNGNTTAFAYNGNNLTSVTDPSGRTIYLTYDSQGRISTVTGTNNNVYNFTYANDTLISVSFPLVGNLSGWSYSYDSNGQMLTKTDPQGYVTTYAYDNEGRVTSSIDPEGRVKSVSYDLSTNTATVTEKDGGVWTYGYDPLLNVTTQKTDPQGNTTAYTYDQYKDLISTREADGSITSYTYDEYGNMASVTDPTGNTTTYTYNEFGQTTSIANSEGNVTRYEYDSNGNQAAVIDSTGAITQYQYDAKGNLTKVTNPLGQATTFTYDQFNNMISVTDSAGATTRFTFDISGNMTSQTDPNGSITRFEYNSLNQLVKITDSQGNITTYSYDSNGNRTSITDANGKTTYYEYNYKGQLIKVTDALGNVTQYMYGGTGCSSCGGGGDKLTSITDANGQTTMYLYDSLGRLIKETDSLGNTITYSYDSKGNLISKTDSNMINYNYDTLGRLTKKIYPDGSVEVFEYNSKGNITSTGNKDMAYQLSYDSNGRLIASIDSNGLTVRYEYDAMGNRTKMITPEGKVITYKYDANNRLIELTSDAGTFKFAYDSLGRRIKLINPNGTYTTYAYDKNSRLTELVHKDSKGVVINSFRYTHDNVGNRISKTTPDKTIAYQYDSLYRLTEALSSTPGNSSNSTGKGKGIQTAIQQQKEYFTYDSVGNRLTSDKNKTYSYNAGNQLIAENGNTYSYDKNGNLISKTDASGTTHYSYDYENRLTKVTTSIGVIVEFKYDPFGRRIEKKVEGNDGTKVYNYVYDNEDIILEYETKTDGKIETTKYTHGLGIDEPLAIEQKGDIYFYHADGLGSIIALTDIKQRVVQSYTYDSFGGMKQSGDKVKQPYTFTGREWDKEIGFYFYRARYYDADIGRFISFDPILHSANAPPVKVASCGNSVFGSTFDSLLFTPAKLNPFLYVVGNPVRYKDPLGLAPGADNCEYGRYAHCNKMSFVSKWCCKVVADEACRRSGLAACCELEKAGCMGCASKETDETKLKVKEVSCEADYVKCLSGASPSR